MKIAVLLVCLALLYAQEVTSRYVRKTRAFRSGDRMPMLGKRTGDLSRLQLLQQQASAIQEPQLHTDVPSRSALTPDQLALLMNSDFMFALSVAANVVDSNGDGVISPDELPLGDVE